MKIITMSKGVITDKDLTPSEKYTFLVLSNFYNAKNNNAFPSMKTMVKVGGLTEAQYCRALQKLEEKKYIHISKEQGESFQRNKYYFKSRVMEEFVIIPAEMLSFVQKKQLSYQALVFFTQLKEIHYRNVNKFDKLSKSKIAAEYGYDRKTVVKNLKTLDSAMIIDYDGDPFCKNRFTIDFRYDKQCGIFIPLKNGDPISK